MMRKGLAMVLVTSVLMTTVSSGYAEGLGSLFGGAAKEITSLFGNSSENSMDEVGSNSFLNDLGTIIGGLTAEEAGIPKEIHYEDYELFKKDIDAIEAYFQEYVDFMKKYDASDLSMLADYTSFLASYVEASRVLESLDENKMTTQEKNYYTKVLLRINKILYSAL